MHQIQQYTGVPYGEAELRLVYRLYVARLKHGSSRAVETLLNQVSSDLVELRIDDAAKRLNSVQ